MKRIVPIVAIVVLFLAALFGVYSYLDQQQKMKDLESENTSLNEDLDAADEIETADDTSDNDEANPTQYTSEKGIKITVTAPARGSKIVSPLTVEGSVPGSWSHEGQFTIRLLGEDGGVLAEQPAKLNGDWMTENMVPFTAKLTFNTPDSATGKIVLVKANPSGKAENNDSVTIPIQF